MASVTVGYQAWIASRLDPVSARLGTPALSLPELTAAEQRQRGVYRSEPKPRWPNSQAQHGAHIDEHYPQRSAKKSLSRLTIARGAILVVSMKQKDSRLTGNSRPFVVTKPAANQPALWAIEPSTPMAAIPLSAPGLADRAAVAIRQGDTSDLLMVLNEAIESGHHRIAGELARTGLNQKMSTLPGVSAKRLHAMAIAGSVDTAISSVAGLSTVADQLRNAAVMHEIGFGLTNTRANPYDLSGSLDATMMRAKKLAKLLERTARGEPIQQVKLIRQLSFFGLINVARGLAQVMTYGRGANPLDVSIAAQIRRYVGPGRGLEAQLLNIEKDPTNTAARNSACACLVDMGLPGAGLDHLVVSLLQPDHFVGNTGRRALREAGYPKLSEKADEISVLMVDRRPKDAPLQVFLHAASIISGLGRRTQAELALLNLHGRWDADRIQQARLELDRVKIGAGR